jgi:hypothetical protein
MCILGGVLGGLFVLAVIWVAMFIIGITAD